MSAQSKPVNISPSLVTPKLSWPNSGARHQHSVHMYVESACVSWVQTIEKSPPRSRLPSDCALCSWLLRTPFQFRPSPPVLMLPQSFFARPEIFPFTWLMGKSVDTVPTVRPPLPALLKMTILQPPAVALRPPGIEAQPIVITEVVVRQRSTHIKSCAVRRSLCPYPQDLENGTF